MATEKKRRDLHTPAKSLSLHPLTPDEALKGAMEADPEEAPPKPSNTPSNKPPKSKSVKKKK